MYAQLIKKYKVDKKKFRLNLIVLLIISIPIFIYLVSNLIESYKVLQGYDPDVRFITDLQDGDKLFDNIMYNLDQRENGYNIMIYSAILFFILHIHFFTNVKMIIDRRGINIYSIYKKEPTKVLQWNEIISIQLGNVHTETSRALQYGMKVRLTDSDSYETKEFIPIKRLENYQEIVKNIDEIGEIYSIEIYHIDD